MRNILVCLFIFFSCNISKAQTYLEPILGFAVDVRENQHLNMVNAGVQLTIVNKSGYEFSIGTIYGFGIKQHGSDSSFTLNPSFPIYRNAEKTIHSAFSGIYTNHRFRFFKTGNNQYVNLNFLAGLRFQKVVVKYEQANPDYIILNPETNYNRLGIYTGAGLEYVFLLTKGRLLFQSNILSPSLRAKKEKINSFNYPVPLNFNISYSIDLKKKL